MVKVEWNLPTESNDSLTCVTWTLARLLQFYGIADPTLIFGSGLGFRMDRATGELLWWPPAWVEPAARLYGLRFRECDLPDFDRGLERLAERLQAGHPTIVVVDDYWLPYTAYFRHIHYGHCITVVGYDAESQEVTVVDAGPCRYLGPMAAADLRRAMDITSLPRGNSLFRYFELTPPSRPPALDRERIGESLRAGCQGLRGEGSPPGVAAGVAGIREYSAFLEVLPERLNRDRDLASGEFKAHHFACVYWGEQRMWYARFLEQAGQLLGGEGFEAPVRLCLELYDDWRIVAAMFIKALAWDAAAMIARMQRRLNGMADLEEETLAALEWLSARVAGPNRGSASLCERGR